MLNGREGAQVVFQSICAILNGSGQSSKISGQALLRSYLQCLKWEGVIMAFFFLSSRLFHISILGKQDSDDVVLRAGPAEVWLLSPPPI